MPSKGELLGHGYEPQRLRFIITMRTNNQQVFHEQHAGKQGGTFAWPGALGEGPEGVVKVPEYG